jgi:S1-C subfamily serine protease
MTDDNITFSIHGHAVFLVQDNDEGRPLGTAFCFIKPEWIVTAKHVVLDMGVPSPNLSLVSKSGSPLNVSIIFEDPYHDIAVLRIEGQSPCDVPLFPSFERYTGQRGLVSCGYAPSLSSHEEGSYSIWLEHFTSYDREERIRNVGDESLIVFDAPWIEGGHSGGPVFDLGGHVVAVLIDRIPADNGVVRARATSILHLLRFLEFQDP